MRNAIKKFRLVFDLCRGYSLPISFMSWLIPFVFALFDNGNIFFGLISLIGILLLHMASNLFDDIIDYLREINAIKKGLRNNFNFQEGKCINILNGNVSLKQAFIIDFLLFFIVCITGLFFIITFGLKLFYIIIPTAILCLLYPILGCLGFGEILIAIIFSPLLYFGVYFVMTGNFSYNILLLSISTGLLSVAILHNHMLLDYKYDKTNRKITLCRISGSEKNALILLAIFIFSAYFNLLLFIYLGKLSLFYLLPFLSIPNALILLKIMHTHINNPEEEIKYNIFMGFIKKTENTDNCKRNFLTKFLTAQNLMTSFTLLLCLSIIADKVFN